MMKAPVKENETNTIQEENTPSKSHTELLHKTIEELKTELAYMKENYVPLEKFTAAHKNYLSSESDRKLNMERYRQTHEKWMKETSMVRKLDAELENTREQLRKVRDYNVTCTEKIQHLEALLVMYMGEGKENVSDSN